MSELEPPNAPLTDEQIVAANIGAPLVLDSPIALRAYDPEWPLRYAALARDAALGAKVLKLEHVGSTSVPGLWAKPVIDIILAVADSNDEPSYVPALEARGFALKIREPDWFAHRLPKTPDADANLHVFTQGCEEIARMLALRDWLRTHDEDRALYERTKQELARRTWKYTQNYADAKSGIVNAILSRALGPKPERACSSDFRCRSWSA